MRDPLNHGKEFGFYSKYSEKPLKVSSREEHSF